MKWKTISTMFIATLFLATIASNTYSGSALSLPPAPLIVSVPDINFSGFINISANGSVNYHGSGNTNIIDRSGNIYTLSGNVFGAINIMYNGTIFNGQNYTISNNSQTQSFTMNISKANNVSVKNLRINTAVQSGISISKSSDDTLFNLNIESATVALIIGAETDHISVSNSVFSLNTSIVKQAFLTNTIMSGACISSGNLNFIKSSTNVSFTNDIIYNSALNLVGAGGFINSPNTIIDNITIHATTTTGFIISSNSTTVKDSSFNGYLKNAITMSHCGNYTLSNINITGNNFNLSPDFDPNAGYPICAILTISSNATISKNDFNLGNATSGNTGSCFNALKSSKSNIYWLNNSITFNNTGANSVCSILENGGNLTMEGNNISLLNTVEGNNAVDTTYTNVVAVDNEIYFNSGTPVSIAGYGIQSTGGNIIEQGNRIVSVKVSIVGFSNSNSLNLSITGNSMEFYNSSIMNGITVNFANSGSWTHIDGNYLFENGSSSSSIGFDLFGDHNTYLDNNTVILNNNNSSDSLGLYSRNVNVTVISGNSFSRPDSKALCSFGVKMFNTSKSIFANNSYLNYHTALYSKDSNNDSFYGNFFNNSAIPLNLTSTNYTIFYHNDFINYKSHGFIINASSNDVFNLSLAVGGNYWSSYNGSDGNNDGIGDSPFNINGTFNDQYPLMKPWLRPRVVFVIPSSMVGTLWSVTFNGKTVQSNGSEITFIILNAQYENYSYKYYNTTFYYANIQSGELQYNGTGIVSSIPYLHYSYIVGTLNIQNSSVYVNGKEISVINGKFNITVTAGVYNIKITATGFEPFNGTYDITPGETLHIVPLLTEIPSLPKPYNFDYIIIIIVIAAVAVGVGIYLRKTNKI